LNTRDEPAVIISASGMCEGGRILHHLKHHATRPESIVLFVSFQAEHTLGRRIMNGDNPVRIYGEYYEIAASVRKAEGYSAHADRDGLLRWASRVQESGNVRQIFLVHGEHEGLTALAAGLEDGGAADVRIPERGQKFDL
jgi:metallo-beta-lactamase family protein